jgi:hypothetical protein
MLLNWPFLPPNLRITLIVRQKLSFLSVPSINSPTSEHDRCDDLLVGHHCLVHYFTPDHGGRYDLLSINGKIDVVIHLTLCTTWLTHVNFFFLFVEFFVQRLLRKHSLLPY